MRKEVIAKTENDHNPPVLEHCYYASKLLTNQITCRNLVLRSSVNSTDGGFIAYTSCETWLKSYR